MQIEDFKKAKRQLEQDILASVEGIVHAFESNTGYSPWHITIDVDEDCSIGLNGNKYYISDVSVGVEI